MKRLVIFACVMLAYLNGCAIIMAASGNRSPDESSIKVGATKSDIGYQFGNPKKTKQLDSGFSSSTYVYSVGDESSGGRAIAHGVMDILTVFIWELIGTPIELFQGETESVEIKYGPDGRVASIRRL